MSTSISPRLLGKYELREPLRHGGTVEVWKAFDIHLQRLVALKSLYADLLADPDFIAQFEREARIIASLYHPNIVQVHDFQIVQDGESRSANAYIVMDYIGGQTLTTYLNSASRVGIFP